MNGPDIEAYLEEMVSLFSTLHESGVIRTSALDDLVEASEQLREVIPDVPANTLRATVNNLKKQGRVVPFPGDAYGLGSDREQAG